MQHGNLSADKLLDAKPTLGALDYQAHNIVIDNQQPYFIANFIDYRKYWVGLART